MNNEQQRKLDSLIRARDVITSDPDLVGLLATSTLPKEIDDAVTQIREHITAQGATTLVIAGLSARIRGLSKDLARNHLGPIAKFARVALRMNPEFATLTRTVDFKATKRLVRHAYAVAEAATPYAETMTAAGLPADNIDQLRAAADLLNGMILEREPLRAARVHSTATIAELIERGRASVRRISAVIEMRLVSNEPALSGWKTASRVHYKVGRVRRKTMKATP